MSVSGRRRRTWLLVACVALASYAAGAVILASNRRPPSDYLQPALGDRGADEISPGYTSRWRQLLLVARGDIATFVLQPSFGPDAAAMLSTGEAAGAHVLTCTFASENIWYYGAHRLEVDGGPENAAASRAPMSIRRVEVPFPSDAAAEIAAAWDLMLDLPRVERDDAVFDGEVARYSTSTPDAVSAREGSSSSASSGRSAGLEKLGRLLLEYCDAAPTARSRIAADIASRSRELRSGSWLEYLTKRWSGP